LWLPFTNYGALVAVALISGAILGIYWAVRTSNVRGCVCEADSPR
jgi:hypothetical protein